MSTSFETHEEAVNFVKDVFRSMGGVVYPPNRPRHIPQYTRITAERNNFMMDFENACLSQNWDNSIKPYPKGATRHKDLDWARMITSQVYPHHSDIDFREYVDWVSSGGGDEFFQEEDM